MTQTKHSVTPAQAALPPPPVSRTTALVLAAIVLLGAVLRLWIISFTPLDASFSTADDGDYYQRAFRFAATGKYIDDGWLIRPPFHTMFFAFWIKIGMLLGKPLLAIPMIQLAQTVLGSCSALLAFGIARRLFHNNTAGVLFAAFMALWFPFVEQPSVLFSELLYLFFFLLHYWLLTRYDHNQRWIELVLSGLALGVAALTRSPALYSLVFVAIWFACREGLPPLNPRQWFPWLWQCFLAIYKPVIVIAVCCIAVVSPWTIRNYIEYNSFIPVDTLGQINVLLDLDTVEMRNVHIAELRKMPQADRAAYATAKARELFAEDPMRIFDGVGLTFLHVWKAQYVEDLYIKQSFFTRPLRETTALGLFGDLMWFAYTLAGLIGLAARTREGWHHRLFNLAWLSYTMLTVVIFHVEPRYLLPIWTIISLYGAGTLAQLKTPRQIFGPRPVTILQSVLAIAFLVVFVSYRNYPQIISTGMARERAISAGEAAYKQGNYAQAEQHFRDALAAQPQFVDAKIDLALALSAQGKLDEARQTIEGGGARRADLLRGALAIQAGEPNGVSSLLTRTEASSGEDILAWAMDWMRVPATNHVKLGEWADIGYVAGFNRPESDDTGSFRWMRGTSTIRMHLPEPLREGAMLTLRLAAGQPGETPLTVRMGSQTATAQVTGGLWRSYHFSVPSEFVGQQSLTIELDAPTFVPAAQNPDTDDLRVLSIRVSDVWIEE